MLKRILKLTGIQSEDDRKADLYQNLLRHEAKIGGELFGPVPKDGRREFFCLDEYTWVWHEEWTGKSGSVESRTTRYVIRPDGIVKAQDGRQYQKVSKVEVGRLLDAITAYERRVKNDIYQTVA